MKTPVLTTLFSLSISMLVATAVSAGCGGSSGFGSPFDTDSGTSSGTSGGSSGSGTSSGSGSGTSSGTSSGSLLGDGSVPPPKEAGGCTNLQCDVHACAGGGTTSISGKVLDPAGHNPIYNVVVYVPNSVGGVLSAIPIGVNSASCSCGALFSGEPIVDTNTDTDGNFTLKGVPDGTNIPLVIQIGKWRKEIVIPQVTACQDNAIGSQTLPKNLTDGKYASIPNIAVSTGGVDTLECLLTRVGIDEAMFTGVTSGPGIHVFQGSGGNAAANGNPQSTASLWDTSTDLSQYDIVMLSCEGSPNPQVTGTNATAVATYVNNGGRVFAEHYHYDFFVDGANAAYPEFTNVANWETTGNDSPYNNDIGNIIQSTLPNGKAFPEGADLKTWLGNVGALNASGELVVPVANARVDATVGSGNLATPWTQSDPSVTPPTTQYFSWDMPFNAPVDDAGTPAYCGRVVYSDMHVSGSAADYATSQTVPTGCDSTATLQPDEDAIEFILFDLSSCLTPVGSTPQPPPPEGGTFQ